MKKKAIPLYILTAIIGLTGCQNTKAIPQPTNSGSAESETQPPSEAPEDSEAENELPEAETKKPVEFSLSINSSLLTFPMGYTDFLGYGFSPESSIPRELLPQEISADIKYIKDGLTLYPQMINNTLDAAPYEECTVAGIIIRLEDNESSADSVVLADSLVMGQAGEDRVLDVCGTPDDQWENEGELTYSYETGAYNSILLTFDQEQKVLSSIDLHNFILQDFGADMTNESPAQKAVEAAAYTAPSELGKDILGGNILYEEDLYHMPAPVRAFLDNGWTLDSVDFDTQSQDNLVAGMSAAQIVLSKDDVHINASVTNYETNAAAVEDCFIENLAGSSETDGADMQLPPGISLGTEKEELLKYLDGVTFQEEETEDTLCYTLPASRENKSETDSADKAENPGSLRVEIIMDKKTGAVIQLHIHCPTKSAGGVSR